MLDVYTALVILVISLGLLMNNSNSKKRDIYINITCLSFFLIMGLRDAFRIGNDSTSSYVSHFNVVGKQSIQYIVYNLKEQFNIGFDLIMKVIYELTNGNYQIFVILLSAFIIISFRFLIKKYSTSPIQSFCYYMGLLYYSFMFSAEKQALAMAILVFAFDAAIERKLIKFLVLTIIAGTIHFPALIFLPVYIFAGLNWNSGYLTLTGVLLLFTYSFRDQILQFMMKAYGNDVELDALNGVAFLRNKAIIMIIILVVAIFVKPPRGQNRLYKTLLFCMCTAIVFQTFCGYNNIFERLADYFFYYSIIFIPMIFSFPKELPHRFTEQSENLLKIVLPALFCIFLIYRFNVYMHSGADNLFPYYFFFK